MFCCDALQRAKDAVRPFADLPLRLTLGIIFIAHGADKLFGTFGGGFQATATGFGQMGFQPGWFHAALAGGGEFIGGILVLLGLFTRFGAFLLCATMVVAVFVVHWSAGLFAKDGGFEFPLALLGAAAFLLLAGPGPISIDARLCGRKK
jgi:putative oxidoreductase